jgi:hypothetical protein
MILICVIIIFFAHKKNIKYNENNQLSNNTKDYEWDNIEISGAWKAELSNKSVASWIFDYDNKFKYYEDGELKQQGTYMYICYNENTSIESDGNSYYITNDDNRFNELLLLYKDGGQKVITGVWTNYYVLRMNINDRIIYYLNEDENILEN